MDADIQKQVKLKIIEAARLCGKKDGSFNWLVSILEDPEDHEADDAFSGYLAGMVEVILEQAIQDRVEEAVDAAIADELETQKVMFTQAEVDEKIREARIDERESMKFILPNGDETFVPYVQYRFVKDGLILDWENRSDQLKNGDTNE